MTTTRILTVFPHPTPNDPGPLQRSVDSFLALNASDLDKFKILIHLYRPDYATTTLVKSRYLPYTPYLLADSKPLCAPCVLRKNRVRYGIIIPTNWVAIAPIAGLLDEIRHVLRTVPDIGYIRLTHDTDLTNRITHSPMVRHYHTRRIMVGNGNPLTAGYPVVYKVSSSPRAPTGTIKPVVFKETPRKCH